MRNFSNVCAITRSNLPILQACHLEPFSLNKNHSTNNGIPLEPTLHAMLDRGLLAIHPHNMTIHFSIECYYKKIYEGKKIAPHYIELDKKALHKVWKNYLLVIKTTRKQLDDNGGTLAAEY
ncbi:HNH endonuclease [Klebsiella pneumoniae]|nr:HNH endonuclease [Klebsiella pneumoniae]MEB5564480.1 HNH endonuclease [Klebsiella pneumoniae]MEB5663370.1 HNH endonuclease [Klebsiella pneumoniae]